jgi:hypothetical protein
MPLISKKTEEDIQQLATLALQTVEILASQNAVDGQNRQRFTLDAIAAGLTLATVTSVGSVGTVSTVTTVGTVSSVTNIAAVAGWDQRQYENPANLLFNSQLSTNLSFG